MISLLQDKTLGKFSLDRDIVEREVFGTHFKHSAKVQINFFQNKVVIDTSKQHFSFQNLPLVSCREICQAEIDKIVKTK